MKMLLVPKDYVAQAVAVDAAVEALKDALRPLITANSDPVWQEFNKMASVVRDRAYREAGQAAVIQARP